MDESTIRYAVIIGCTFIILLLQVLPYRKFSQVNVCDIAKRDLSKLGITDYRFVNSLNMWLFSILVIAYRIDKQLTVMPTIRDWSENYIDKEIDYDVERPYTDFLKIIDDARENNTEPVFKVSQEYDYHNLSKTLKYNDYIDCESLMAKIDELIGVT